MSLSTDKDVPANTAFLTKNLFFEKYGKCSFKLLVNLDIQKQKYGTIKNYLN